MPTDALNPWFSHNPPGLGGNPNDAWKGATQNPCLTSGRAFSVLRAPPSISLLSKSHILDKATRPGDLTC